MSEIRKLAELPEFPDNILGLRRGSVLEAMDEVVNQITLNVGTKIVIGYDGEYVRFGPFTWSIEQILEEIERGIWRITGSVWDLSDPEELAEFGRMIEHIEIGVDNPN